MKYIKYFEAIVKTEDLTKVELEGEVLEVIEKHLADIGIESRDQFKKESDETISSIEDIFREIGYEFPDIDINFERYLYDHRISNNYTEKKYRQYEKEVEKSITVKIHSDLFNVIYTNGESREIAIQVKDCIERCKTFAKIVDSRSNINRMVNCFFSFTTNSKYEYYELQDRIIGNRYNKILSIRSYSEYNQQLVLFSSRDSEIYDELSDGLKKELRSMGYGLIMSRGSSTGGYCFVDIEVFKLKKSEYED